MKNSILLGALLTLIGTTLSGCSTPGYKCPLSDTGDDCASMSAAYSAAIHEQRGEYSSAGFAVKEPVSVFGRRSEAAAEPATAKAGFTGFAADAPHGGPVYAQAQVHRVWSAPWTDAAGVLHGGEYLYFTTPGHWSYGETMAPGAVSGIFTPVKPNAFGIAELNQSDTAKPKQAATSSGARPTAQPANNSAKAGSSGAATNALSTAGASN